PGPDGEEQDRTFHLVLDMNALCRFEEKTGLSSLDKSIWKMNCNLSTMLWAGVLAHHPEFDSPEGLDAIRSYMTGRVRAVITAINEGYAAAISDKKDTA